MFKFYLFVYLYGIPIFYLLSMLNIFVTPGAIKRLKYRKSEYHFGCIICALFWPVVLFLSIISILIFITKGIFLFVKGLI